MSADTVGVYSVTTNLVDLETGKVLSTITSSIEITAASKAKRSKKAVVAEPVVEASVSEDAPVHEE